MDATVAQIILQDRKIAYAIADRDFKIIEVSAAAGTLLSNGCWLGHSLFEDVPELVGSEDALSDILTGEAERSELAWVNRTTSDGRTLYLTMVDLPYRDHSGHIVGLIHLVQDVTGIGTREQHVTQQRNELRILREELDRRNLLLTAANAELRRVDETKSAFVSVAAHELRSPLTSIAGYLEMLLDGDVGPMAAAQEEYVRIAHRSAQRMLAVTNDLLDLTRIEVGRIQLVLRPTELAGLAESVASECAPQLEAKAQRLTLRSPTDLPMALCDSARAAQIIGNLISNASKYSPPSSIVTVSLAPATDAGYLQVSVADNGVGIAPEDQPKLFDRFYRAGSAVLTGASGIGLGLHIARSLVELHGGRIWFESELNQGSTFHVTFPIADSTEH